MHLHGYITSRNIIRLFTVFELLSHAKHVLGTSGLQIHLVIQITIQYLQWSRHG